MSRVERKKILCSGWVLNRLTYCEIVYKMGARGYSEGKQVEFIARNVLKLLSSKTMAWTHKRKVYTKIELREVAGGFWGLPS